MSVKPLSLHIDSISGVDDDGGEARVLRMNENPVEDVTNVLVSIEEVSESQLKSSFKQGVQ